MNCHWILSIELKLVVHRNQHWVYFRQEPLHNSADYPTQGSQQKNTVIMPTPESELFKSQKPSVPPTFNGVDFDDTKAFKAAEDAIIREQWVGAMMTRLVGEELDKCYMREGVNHLENCGHLRGLSTHGVTNSKE